MTKIKNIVESIWRSPEVLRKAVEVSKLAQTVIDTGRTRAEIDGEDEWFLRCTKRMRKLTCTEVDENDVE